MLRSISRLIKVSCVVLPSSACYGNTALLQCVLRTNCALRINGCFDCTQPLLDRRNVAESRSEIKIWNN